MNSKYRVFDTNVFSSYKRQLKTQDYETMALSLVVFYEMTATKIFSGRRKYWEGVLKKHFEDETLIAPTKEDWIFASRLVWMMQQNNESIPKDATALQNDVLICISVHNFDGKPFIVTDNVKHFSLIADYINDNRKRNKSKLIIQSAKEYFS